MSDNKLMKKTIVVFEHEMSLDHFPQLRNFTEEQLTSFLNDAVIQIFELREKEEKLNEGGTHSFIRIVDVI